MNRIRIQILALSTVLVALAPSAVAQTASPTLIPFQGRLTNQANVPYTAGQYTVTFNLYREAVGGATLWTERHEKVGVVNGMVNVFLGSITQFPAEDSGQPFFATVKHLGITIDADSNTATADPEMVPRQMIIPAFFAKQAQDSSTLAGVGWEAVFDTGDPGSGTFRSDKLPPITNERLDAAGLSAVASGGVIFSSEAENSNLVAAGYQRIGAIEVGSNVQILPQCPLTPRVKAFTAWTGSELLIWGGGNEPGRTNGPGASYFNGGARFNAANRTWSLMSTSGQPSPRSAVGTNTAGVWTGTHFLIYGGFNVNSVGTGGLYDPEADSWTSIPAPSLPNVTSSRFGFAAAWTGSEYLIWGGEERPPTQLVGDGAKFNPDTGAWVAMESTGAPSARHGPCSVWTGTEFFIWGGTDASGIVGNGALYNPTSDSWRTVKNTGTPPAARTSANAVWTGSEILVWGGGNLGASQLNGARYNPVTEIWTPMADAPDDIGNNVSDGMFHWTGELVLVSGGRDNFLSKDLKSTATYDPEKNTWELGPELPTPLLASSATWCPGLAGGVHFFGDPSSAGGSTLSGNTLLVRPPPHVLYFYARP